MTKLNVQCNSNPSSYPNTFQLTRTFLFSLRSWKFFWCFFFFFCGSQSKRLSCTAALKSKQQTVRQEGVGSMGDAFSPRLLPHRFLFRPKYSICAVVSLTNRTTKEKKKNTPKKPPATQATRPVKTKSSVVSFFR